MLEGGPYDMNLITYAAIGKMPDELRVGSHNELMESEKFSAAVYRKIEVEEMPVSMMHYGLYRFVAMRESAESLVDVWIS